MRDLLDLKKIPDSGPKPDGSQDGQSFQSEVNNVECRVTTSRERRYPAFPFSIARASEPPGDVTARNPKLEQRP